MLRDAELAAVGREGFLSPVEDIFAGMLAIEPTAAADHHLDLPCWLIGPTGSLDPAIGRADGLTSFPETADLFGQKLRSD